MAKQNQFVTIGFNMAMALELADTSANSTKRKVILECAAKHCDNEDTIKLILEGVEKYHTEQKHTDNVIRKAKSETKAVFDAVSKTLVTNENLLSLQEFHGNFHEFIEKARELRGKKQTGTGERTRVVKLSAIAESKIVGQMKKAIPVQLAALAEKAVTDLHSRFGGNMAGAQTLRIIHAHAMCLADDTKAEEFFRKIGEQIREISADAIHQMEDAAKLASLNLGKAQQVSEDAVTEIEIEDEAELKAA